MEANVTQLTFFEHVDNERVHDGDTIIVGRKSDGGFDHDADDGAVALKGAQEAIERCAFERGVDGVVPQEFDGADGTVGRRQEAGPSVQFDLTGPDEHHFFVDHRRYGPHVLRAASALVQQFEQNLFVSNQWMRWRKMEIDQNQ